VHALLWLIEGLAAGWLAGKMLAGEGKHLIMEALMGMAGGIGGGFAMSSLANLVHDKMIFTDMAAILGGVMFTAASRLIDGKRKATATQYIISRTE
jgi:uncharacterized membrane protein YeaQ/YmgE (transglycosylase-associated protein family)